MSENKPDTTMTHVAFESKLRSVVRSSMYTCPGNWLTIEHGVVYYAWAVHAFCVKIECRHCIEYDIGGGN